MKKKVYSTCKIEIVGISPMIMQSASGVGVNNQYTGNPQLSRSAWGNELWDTETEDYENEE